MSASLAKDKKLQPSLNKLLTSNTPKVVLVVNEIAANTSWLRTGLGLRLSDELWVDCTSKTYYLPGENLPSLEDTVDEMFLWVTNSVNSLRSTELPEKSLQASLLQPKDQRGEQITIFVTECELDSSIDTSILLWPLPEHSNRSVYQESHDIIRYSAYFSAEPTVCYECCQKWNIKSGYVKAAINAITKADIILHFWSTNFMTSYYCYTDVAQTFLVFCR